MAKENVEYWALAERDVDPVLSKKINVLIGKDHHFVVYLDENLGIQWSSKLTTWPRPEVLNKVARLESESSFIRDSNKLREIRSQVGEGLVRALSEPRTPPGEQRAGGHDIAMDILHSAEQWIQLENSTASRRWLSSAASFFGSLCALGMLVTICSASLDRWSLAFATAMSGGVGAWASVLNSRQTLNHIDARTGLTNHVLEAFAKIAAGVIGALLFALLVQGEFLLAFVKGSPVLMLGFGLVCGVSERLLPTLIASVERAADQEAIESAKEP